MTRGPIEDSYWADEGVFLAGPYPFLAAADAGARRAAVRALLDAGVRTVIDLRTFVEPPSIRALLGKLADDAAWLRAPILDGAAPNEALLVTVLDAIDASVARGRPVYVHCQGGRGRAGTVVACWWVRHALFTPDEALAELARRREGLAHGHRPSPETAPQWRQVRGWSPGR